MNGMFLTRRDRLGFARSTEGTLNFVLAFSEIIIRGLTVLKFELRLFDRFVIRLGYKKCSEEHCVFNNVISKYPEILQ